MKKIFTLALALAFIAGAAPASAQTANSTLVIASEIIQPAGSAQVLGNFNAVVTGTNVSAPTSALTGNNTITLAPSAYSVTVPNPFGYSITYGSGCSGTAAADMTQTCYISIVDPAILGANTPLPGMPQTGTDDAGGFLPEIFAALAFVTGLAILGLRYRKA